MANTFSVKQFDYLYSDEDFVHFLNTFYSTYDIANQDINLVLDSDIGVEDMNIYIRLILSNVSSFIESLDKILYKLSTRYVKHDRNYVGEIKGRLNIGKYVKQIVTMSTPKVYPCVVKEKDYETPENIFIVFYATVFIDILKAFAKYIRNQKLKNSEKSKELSLIAGYLKDLQEFIEFPGFKTLIKQNYGLRKKYGNNLPEYYCDQIKHRFDKNKIVNKIEYQNAFDWIIKFSNNKLNFSGNDIQLLRYDESKFCDRLFEIWNLYKIKSLMITNFSCVLIEEYGLMDKTHPYTFMLKNSSDEIIEIYFQKGEGLYWEDPAGTKWKYQKENGEDNFKGVPDISVVIRKSIPQLFMIDAKNKQRKSGKNSAEIYKIIGYYDNFRNQFNGIDYQSDNLKAFLLFRNDEQAFSEVIKNDHNDSIFTFSVSPCDDLSLNDGQYIMMLNELLL